MASAGRVLTIAPGGAEVRDETGRRVASLGGHSAVTTAVAATADGTQLATGDDHLFVEEMIDVQTFTDANLDTSGVGASFKYTSVNAS